MNNFGYNKPITAIILAGGNNSRFGKNKAMLNIDGVTFIEHVIDQMKNLCDEIIISTNDCDSYKNLPYKKVQDISKGQGPLMGIYSCLIGSENEVSIVSACDVPKINLPFLRLLLGYSEEYDIVVPILPDGKYEPLYAVYKKTAIPAIKEVLDSKRRKISLIFDKIKVKYVPVGDLSWYFNINTNEDYITFMKTMDKKIYLIFETTRQVIIAERECKAEGFNCLAVPVPREFSSKCGIALEIEKRNESKILILLSEFNITPMKYRTDVSGKSCNL